ncbi:MAG: NEW3 domain-containing protein [Candidatus Bipolaricaulota bacterium]|nr:NEW3 domain-containing protein [Candidatus Bipolaricaulota bacterium]
MTKRLLVRAIILIGILIAAGALWAWKRSSVQYEESTGPLRLSPVNRVLESDPDDFVTVVFTLHNLSDQERSYELYAEAPTGWELLDALQNVTLGPHAQEEFFVTVQIPPATPPGRYSLTVRAQSGSLFAVGRSEIVVRARERLRLALASPDLIVHPNAEKIVPLTVANRGNVSVRVSIAVTAAPREWQFRLRERALTLAPGESKVVELMVKPLAKAELAPGQFTVQATSPSAQDELSVTVVLSP